MYMCHYYYCMKTVSCLNVFCYQKKQLLLQSLSTDLINYSMPSIAAPSTVLSQCRWQSRGHPATQHSCRNSYLGSRPLNQKVYLLWSCYFVCLMNFHFVSETCSMYFLFYLCWLCIFLKHWRWEFDSSNPPRFFCSS